MAYGRSETEVLAAVKARVLADRLEHGELDAGTSSVTFDRAA